MQWQSGGLVFCLADLSQRALSKRETAGPSRAPPACWPLPVLQHGGTRDGTASCWSWKPQAAMLGHQFVQLQQAGAAEKSHQHSQQVLEVAARFSPTSAASHRSISTCSMLVTALISSAHDLKIQSPHSSLSHPRVRHSSRGSLGLGAAAKISGKRKTQEEHQGPARHQKQKETPHSIQATGPACWQGPVLVAVTFPEQRHTWPWRRSDAPTAHELIFKRRGCSSSRGCF